MLLVVDNGSIFTKNLIEFLEKLKINFVVLKPEIINLSDLHDFDSFILSGRRHNNKEMNSKNSSIIKFAVEHNIPLLGICYGAEILCLTLGGAIKKMSSLQKGTEKIKINKNFPLVDNEMTVYESHNYEITKLPFGLISIGSSHNCQNEIIQLVNSNIFGTQFHPEMSDDGKKLIQKFCQLQY